MLKNNTDTMTFLDVKKFFDANEHDTALLDKDHSIQVYRGGSKGNIEVGGKVIVQILFIGDMAEIYLRHDEFAQALQPTPYKICTLNDDVTAIQDVVPEIVFTLIENYKHRRRFPSCLIRH